MKLSFTPVGGYAAVIAVAVALILVLWIAPARRKTTPLRRRVLFALRALATLMTVLALLRPTLVFTQSKKQSLVLPVLVDASRSMQVKDASGGKTRWTALKDTLTQASDAFAALADDFEVQAYTFNEAVEEARVDKTRGGIELADAPEGDQTAIGAALEDVLRRDANKRFVGIVLLGDGAQRAYAPHDASPRLAAQRLADLGYPLTTVSFGQARGLGDVRDVAVEELLTPLTVFAKNQLTASATVRVDGFVNTTIPVQLLFEKSPGTMDVVDVTQIKAGQDAQQLPVELNHVPELPGEYKLTIRAEPQPGELVMSNNELSTFITVKKGGLSVLYLEGARRAEARFIINALGSSPNIQVDYFYIDAQEPDTRPVDLAERFEPGRYDVYILGDLDSQAFDPEMLERLAAAVDQGAGLLMLGGMHSFGAGGYRRTPLGDVLPILIDRTERQNFGERPRGDLHHSGRLQMVPTLAGQRHFALRLGDEGTNREVWEKLPPLSGANRFRGVKPGATVLAQSQEGDDLLIASTYGRGRVMAFAGDSSWRWQTHGFGDAHRRFWRQMVLWLAHQDQSTEGNVWINLAERRYAPGARVEFTAGADSPEGDPVVDARYAAKITSPDGETRDLRLSRLGDVMSGTFTEAIEPGDYALEVTATRDGDMLGTARARFLVYQHDLELDNPAADPALLASLSAMTGGEVIAPEQLPSWLEELKQQAMGMRVATQTRRTLWDTWPFFVLFTGLLSVEWWLRKRWGLA